jgi:hypothetical protein
VKFSLIRKIVKAITLLMWTHFVYVSKVIYRIKLPGPALLGEGKPENQNHAIIFTRGEGLQTIDMNQVSPTMLVVLFCEIVLTPLVKLTYLSSCLLFRRITIWKRHLKWEICFKSSLQYMESGIHLYLELGSTSLLAGRLLV